MEKISKVKVIVAIIVISLFAVSLIFLAIVGLINDFKGTVIGICILSMVGGLLWSAWVLAKYSEQRKKN